MKGEVAEELLGTAVGLSRARSAAPSHGHSGESQVPEAARETIDTSKTTRGIVTVRFQNRPIEVQLPNVRRHLHFAVFLSTPLRETIVQDNVWTLGALFLSF